MSVSAAQVKELRERTGAGMMDCRKALEATAGNMDAAIEKLRMEGQAKAVKKAGRTAADGTIAVAAGADAIAIVEVNCETDFVAKGDDFQAFAAAAARAALDTGARSIDQLSAAKIGGKAVEDVRKEMVAKIGENITVRRVERVAKAGGAIGHYVHAGSRIGVVVALDAGDAELARDLAMHVAASRPQFLKPADVPADVRDAERKVIEAQSADSGKPPEIVKKMIEGRLNKYLGEISLTGQPFVKDPDQTVEKVLAARKGAVARFVRFEVGEGIEKQETDFAAEVAKMSQQKH
ncbi:MAG TPA: translation elongation factor Ts [Candidatus Binatia bacterium]|nr:translation elongation factor Ts [Candidatus Binatia bacterium]